ncbi:MAG: hypothetical protein Satyrvirus2_78 [Satyrvirus sp.]|uniref:Uncharacterized protein n=1 Tax=Satyrvirus sp. TaxID=2487771 RepID=A0A3G5AD30_9VIRU|nr:MAG: hypothetical protein Satyrvirus2_78 [Satyrvirus sp.]
MADQQLKTNISEEELREITSPSVINIIRTIKAVQKRMKEPDISKLEYIRAYDQLSKEFDEFSEKYTTIFTNVVRGANLATIASILYYKDKVEKGLITEEQLSELLAKKYLPANLKAEADMKIKEMKLKK